MIFGALLEDAADRPDVAQRMAREAVDLSRQHAPSFVGALALGIAATITIDPAERDAWLAEGEALLAKPTLSHNHLFFRRYAIEAVLAAGRPAEARRHAAALALHAAAEPMPFTDVVVRRGMLLADAADGRLTNEGRSELNALLAQAERVGCLRLAHRMREALA